MVHFLVEKVRAFSDEHMLLPTGSSLIVGLSGGPDSMALVSLLKALEPHYAYRVIVAHLDHQWRPSSAQDVIFCRESAERYQLTFEYTTADQITLLRKTQSQEDTGRLLRRTYFEQLAQKYDASAIVLGHHYQDQQETFFFTDDTRC